MNRPEFDTNFHVFMEGMKPDEFCKLTQKEQIEKLWAELKPKLTWQFFDNRVTDKTKIERIESAYVVTPDEMTLIVEKCGSFINFISSDDQLSTVRLQCRYVYDDKTDTLYVRQPPCLTLLEINNEVEKFIIAKDI